MNFAPGRKFHSRFHLARATTPMALAEQVAQLSDADLYNAAVIQTLEDYVTEQASRRRRVVSAAQFSAARAKIRDPPNPPRSHTHATPAHCPPPPAGLDGHV